MDKDVLDLIHGPNKGYGIAGLDGLRGIFNVVEF